MVGSALADGCDVVGFDGAGEWLAADAAVGCVVEGLGACEGALVAWFVGVLAVSVFGDGHKKATRVGVADFGDTTGVCQTLVVLSGRGLDTRVWGYIIVGG